MNWIAEELGIKMAEDWYSVTSNHILNRGKFFMNPINHCDGSKMDMNF